MVVLSFCTAESLAQYSEPVLPDPGNPGMSKQQQEQLGQKAKAEVYQQMPVLPDSNPLTQYVQQLGRKLAHVIPADRSWPYEFHVIQQKEINAFALPGGPLFVNVGTIVAADSEAQLAGVMAHEMAHVYMQHSAKQVRQNTVPSILAGLGQVAGAIFGGVGGAVASIGGQMAGGLLSMKYSRADEAQADAVGAIIMYRAGYDPKALAIFFQKLEQQGGSGPQFMSDHPDPGNRVAAVEKEVSNWPPEKWIENTPQFTQMHQDARGIRAYTAQEIQAGAKSGQWAQQNQRNGSATNVSMPPSPAGNGHTGPVSASQVMPSGSFKTLNNSAFSMKYPENWQPMQDQQGGGITIAPQAGVSQNGIAYGVLIGGTGGGGSLDDTTNQLVQNIVQQNQGMQASQPQAIRVNGAQARSVDLMGQSPIADSSGRPLREHDWLVTVERSDGSILSLIFVSPERDFGQLQNTYEGMLRSLHVK